MDLQSALEQAVLTVGLRRAEARVREEARDGASRLTYTTQAIRESLRLYPPIWAMERRVVEDDEIGGFEIPAGSSVYVSPFALHRHPGFWEDSETFDPDRFSPERSAARPARAYLPFGAGPHQCIGSGLALLEMRIILPRVVRRFHLRPLPDPPVVPRPGITLRFKHGRSYNPLQKLAYSVVFFILFPLIVLTGLTMSPGMDSAWPWLVDLFGGRQTARSIHFLVMVLLVLFFIIHIVMVFAAGPINELRSMITGRYRASPGTPSDEEVRHG